MTYGQFALAFLAGVFFGQGTLAALAHWPHVMLACMFGLGASGLGLVFLVKEKNR